MDKIIQAKNVKYTYNSEEEDYAIAALEGINATVEQGEFISVIGKNGSGKSTFARLLNALLIPTEGTVIVDEMYTRDEDYLWEIRKNVGMVFQNPDNQMVASVVVDDIAFGMENLAVPPEEMRQRVNEVMEDLRITKLADRAPNDLSGGQKQKVALAGILAMQPKCIVLDEATAMLDPKGRKDVLNILKKINKERNITIVHITHHMDESLEADRVLVINEGKLILEGTPAQVFSKSKLLKDIGLEVPQTVEVLDALREKGYDIPKETVTIEDAVEQLVKVLKG